ERVHLLGGVHEGDGVMAEPLTGGTGGVPLADSQTDWLAAVDLLFSEKSSTRRRGVGALGDRPAAGGGSQVGAERRPPGPRPGRWSGRSEPVVLLFGPCCGTRSGPPRHGCGVLSRRRAPPAASLPGSRPPRGPAPQAAPPFLRGAAAAVIFTAMSEVTRI